MMKNSDSAKTNKELKLGIFLSYFLIALNIISGFLLVPFIIKSIGQSNYGLYTAASSLITMFIVDLGLGTAVTKFISKYRVTSSQEEINKFISVVFVCFLILSIIILLAFSITFVFLNKIYTSFTDSEIQSFKIVFLIVAGYSVFTFPFSIVNGMLVAYDKVFLTKIADIISKLIFIITTIVVLTNNLGLYFLTSCYALHGIVSVFLKLLFVKLKTPCHFFTKLKANEFKRIFKEVISFSLWAAINSFGRVILVSFAPTILGFTSQQARGSVEISILSIAIQIESYVSLFATAFGSIFYPSISRILFSNGENYTDSLEDFKKFHIKIARIQVLILSLILVGLFVCGKEFIHLWVGDGYSRSYYCILAICLPSLFFYPLQTAENAMAAIEKIRYCALSTLVSLVVGIASSIGLAYVWGSIGVSLGICFGFITRTILFEIFFYKYLKINPFSFFGSTYLSFVIPVIFSIVIGIVVNKFFQESSWIMFLFKALIVAISYSLCICFIGLNASERLSIDKIIKKIFGDIQKRIERAERKNE